MKDFMKEW